MGLRFLNVLLRTSLYQIYTQLNTKPLLGIPIIFAIMLQPGTKSKASTTDRTRWSDEEALCLLHLLFEARRNEQLNNDKISALKEVSRASFLLSVGPYLRLRTDIHTYLL